jgi:hypothetical protein
VPHVSFICLVYLPANICQAKLHLRAVTHLINSSTRSKSFEVGRYLLCCGVTCVGAHSTCCVPSGGLTAQNLPLIITSTLSVYASMPSPVVRVGLLECRLTQKLAVGWVVFLSHIRETFDSCLGQETGHFGKKLTCLFSILQANSFIISNLIHNLINFTEFLRL